MSWIREECIRDQTATSCDEGGGNRLKPALAVRLDGKHIGDVAKMSIDACGEWFTQLHTTLNKNQNEIARRILREINERLGFLQNVGLEYLTLSRASRTPRAGRASASGWLS